MKNKKWDTFPEDTQVGWRGVGLFWGDIKDLPKVTYEKGGCLVCGKEREGLCES